MIIDVYAHAVLQSGVQKDYACVRERITTQVYINAQGFSLRNVIFVTVLSNYWKAVLYRTGLLAPCQTPHPGAPLGGPYLGIANLIKKIFKKREEDLNTDGGKQCKQRWEPRARTGMELKRIDSCVCWPVSHQAWRRKRSRQKNESLMNVVFTNLAHFILSSLLSFILPSAHLYIHLINYLLIHLNIAHFSTAAQKRHEGYLKYL